MPRTGTLVKPYERISQEQIEKIHHASVQILMEPGLLCYNREAADLFQASGAEVTPSASSSSDSPCWLVKIPEKLVSGALESAPKTVKVGARNEDNSLIMKGEEPRVFLVSGSETNIWLDVDFQAYVKKSDPDVEV